VDTAVSSRLAAVSYVAPDNADIIAIKTDVESATTGLASIMTAVAALPSAASIRSGITADHGSGPYGPGVQGLYTINITTVVGTSPTVPVPNVAVAMFNADGSVLLSAGTTDSMGQLSFTANNGTYLVKHYKAGYTFPDDTTAVSGANVTHVCTGTAFSLPSNLNPTTQQLHFYDLNGDTTISVGRKITAAPLSGQHISQSLIDKQVLTTTTDTNGHAMLVLIPGIKYTILVERWGTAVDITITTDTNKLFTDYL
jgi:hypothetical protein